MSWTVKVQILFWKLEGGGGGNLVEAMRKCRELESRIMDLETDVQLSTIRGSTSPIKSIEPAQTKKD